MGILRWQLRIRLLGARLYTRWLRSDFGSIGKGSLVIRPFLAFAPGGIHLGRDATVNSGCWLDCIENYEGERFASRLDIGDGTYIGRNAHIIACGHMRIGKQVVIGDNVYITDNLHGYEDVTRNVMVQPLRHPGPVAVEDEAWIGDKASILPNVTIGKHAVVGSNSVVTKSVPPYCVAVGVPARVIRRYNQETRRWEQVGRSPGGGADLEAREAMTGSLCAT